MPELAMVVSHRHTDNHAHGLTEREELVLRSIVQHYILTANPVGSRFISKRLEEESISAATIRNTMADLEEKGLISHPHTSAGRVPTDRGYRLYVDALMGEGGLTDAERATIRRNIDATQPTPTMMRDVARLVAHISSQLGIVTAPEILDSILARIEFVPLSSVRLLVVLALERSLIRTVTLEVHEEYDREGLDTLAAVLNERLTGLSLREIRSTVANRLCDVVDLDGLVRLLVDRSNTIFAQPEDIDRVQMSPSGSIFDQPEFANREQMRGIVELIENEEMVIHLLERRPGDDETGVEISIGSEIGDQRLTDYSLVTTRYMIGSTTGTIGLIGPKRMDYSRMRTVVDYIARTITKNFQGR